MRISFVPVLIVISIASLLIAFGAEYFMGYKPCNLCILERYPYYFLLFFGSCQLLAPKYKIISYYFILFCLCVSVILSGYHTSLEHGLIKEATFCSKKAFSLKSFYSYLTEPTCLKPEIRIFGFSMTELNLILSSLLLFIGIINIPNIKNSESQGSKA